MKKLPFIVQPKGKPVLVKIGSDESGIFEIERRGYLTVAEKTFVDNFVQNPELTRQMVKLCGVIALKLKKPKEDTFMAIQAVMSGQVNSKFEMEVAEKFDEQISDLMAQMLDIQSKRLLAIATILIQSRVDPEWGIEDTLGLNEEIIIGLSNLYEKEDARIKPEDEKSEEEEKQEVRELVGK